jgi:hypothetical protein
MNPKFYSSCISFVSSLILFVIALWMKLNQNDDTNRDVTNDLYFIPFLLIPLRIYHAMLDMIKYRNLVFENMISFFNE